MSEPFIRTPTKISGPLTEDEIAALKAHSDMWVKRILRTTRTSLEDIVPAIKGLYRVSGLTEPNVVVVPSPLMMVFVYGAAAGYVESNSKFDIRSLIDPKRSYHFNAVIAHAADALDSGTTALYQENTDTVDNEKIIADMFEASLAVGSAKAKPYIKNWSEAWSGGAYWAQNDCFITGCRDVLGLQLPEHENYKFWELCAIHGTFRLLHKKFCVVTDFPIALRQDEQHRPHCPDGPSHFWRDGVRFYYWRGVNVPQSWIEEKNTVPAEQILQTTNIEQRRAGCEIIGWHRIINDLKGVVIDEDGDPEVGRLVEVNLPDSGKEKFLQVLCGTGREFAIPVPPNMRTALEAQSWTWNLDASEFNKPEVRT